MPYEYRKLSPEERKEVVEERRRQGHPLHAPPHPYRESGWYLITAVNFEHQPIMQEPERRDGFQSELLQAFRVIEAEVSGWVILSNHYHILSGVNSLDSVSDTLKQLHGTTSRRWNGLDGLTGKRRVWYKFTDRWIRDEKHYYRALNYIHYNPVKHGHTDDPYEWRWSSVHWYYEHKGREWLRVMWKEYAVGDFGGVGMIEHALLKKCSPCPA